MKKNLRKILVCALTLTLLLTALPLPTQAAGKKTGRVHTQSVYVNKGKKVKIPHTGSVTFSSDDKRVATVSNKGVVKGVKSGNTFIKAKSYRTSSSKKQTSNSVHTYVITSSNPIKSIAVATDKPKINMSVGDKTYLNYTVSPNNHTDIINFFSSNPAVVEMDERGNLTAKAIGTAKISIIASSGVSKSVMVTVKENKKKYSTQYDIRVPNNGKKLGKLEILKYELISDRGYIYGSVDIKNNDTKAIDKNSSLTIKFYDSKNNEIKMDDYYYYDDYNKVYLSSYIPAKTGTKDCYNGTFYIPDGVKSFKITKANIKKPDASSKLYKAGKNINGINFPKFPRTVKNPDKPDAKVSIEKITNGKKGAYVYIKNTSKYPLDTPNITPIIYNSKKEIIEYENIRSVFLLPGQTYKAQIDNLTGDVKSVDLVVDTNSIEVESEYTYTSIKGKESFDGIKFPEKEKEIEFPDGTKIKLNKLKTKEKRNANTGWHYQTDINIEFKVTGIPKDLKDKPYYHYIEMDPQFFSGNYVVSGYGYYIYGEAKLNKTFNHEQYISSRFQKKDKKVQEFNRIDFLIEKETEKKVY